MDNTVLFQFGDLHNGIPVCVSNMDKALKEVEFLMKERPHSYVCFLEQNLFHKACLDEEVKRVIQNADLAYPDGIAVAKVLSFSTGETVQRVAGPSFMLKACEYGISKKWRHFFLGGQEGIAPKLAEVLSKKYPGLCVAGWYTPPFRPLTDEEEQHVKQLIEESHADLLWVGLGGPKQELWMQSHVNKIDVPVMLGVGAAFDFHTNNRAWAPKLIRDLGYEWLWRMLTGGKKTFSRNLKCVSHISYILLFEFLLYKLHLRKRRKITVKMK